MYSVELFFWPRPATALVSVNPTEVPSAEASRPEIDPLSGNRTASTTEVWVFTKLSELVWSSPRVTTARKSSSTAKSWMCGAE